MKKILIAGGAGYIGSHVANQLIEKKYKVFILDNLSTGDKKNIPKKSIFFKCDICEKEKIDRIIKNIKPDCIFHFAAKLSVPESEKKPKDYFYNNIYGTTNLLDMCVKYKIKKFLFSSTCAVYGSVNGKVNEKKPTFPESIYAKTKKICEKIILDYSNKFKIKYSILRYFNVVGAHPKGIHGQFKSQGLFKKLSNNIINKRFSINVFGDNYPTKDGTCIRDYIDVNDLSELHILSYKKIQKNLTLNCGYNKGYSVKEVIRTFEKIIKKKIKINYKNRRQGDLISVWSNNSFLKKNFPNWKQKYSLEDSIKNSLNWEKKIAKK